MCAPREEFDGIAAAAAAAAALYHQCSAVAVEAWSVHQVGWGSSVFHSSNQQSSTEVSIYLCCSIEAEIDVKTCLRIFFAAIHWIGKNQAASDQWQKGQRKTPQLLLWRNFQSRKKVISGDQEDLDFSWCGFFSVAVEAEGAPHSHFRTNYRFSSCYQIPHVSGEIQESDDTQIGY